EGSLAPADGSDSSRVSLDLLEPVQERDRFQRRLQGRGSVQEWSLAGGSAYRLGLVVRAHRSDKQLRRLPQLRDNPIENGLTVPQVRSQANVRKPCHPGLGPEGLTRRACRCDRRPRAVLGYPP